VSCVLRLGDLPSAADQADDTAAAARAGEVATTMKRPTALKFKLTKIDVAEAQIKAAVRMFFEGAHTVPVYTLANAAREIVATIGELIDVETAHQIVAAKHGTAVEKRIKRIANFFKHADRDPRDTIELNETTVELVLELACNDFARVTGGMPIEAQVYEAWVNAVTIENVSKAPLRNQYLIKRAIALFPGVRGASTLAEQKTIGLRVMERALQDSSLEMEIKRVVPARGSD
jgi:hypothetical protein